MPQHVLFLLNRTHTQHNVTCDATTKKTQGQKRKPKNALVNNRLQVRISCSKAIRYKRIDSIILSVSSLRDNTTFYIAQQPALTPVCTRKINAHGQMLNNWILSEKEEEGERRVNARCVHETQTLKTAYDTTRKKERKHKNKNTKQILDNSSNHTLMRRVMLRP